MDNSHNIRTSVSVFVIVFAVVLAFSYFYEMMKNKGDSTYRFDWKKQSLISLAASSGAALITSLFLMCKEGKMGMLKFGMGCAPCGMKNKMQLTRYRMSCSE